MKSLLLSSMEGAPPCLREQRELEAAKACGRRNPRVKGVSVLGLVGNKSLDDLYAVWEGMELCMW